MKDVVKNDIFLTADMVVSMSKEFGVPFTAEDFEGTLPSSPAWSDIKTPKYTTEDVFEKNPLSRQAAYPCKLSKILTIAFSVRK